jgi:hypothetical protein
VTIRARNRAVLAAIVITAATAAFFLLPMRAWNGADPVRDVRLVARDMTFYLEGSDAPNPVLVFRAGERVRVRLRNDDSGMDHDFSVAAWQVKTELLSGVGEDTIVITVPDRKGTETYSCTPHAEMMRGTIRIE